MSRMANRPWTPRPAVLLVQGGLPWQRSLRCWRLREVEGHLFGRKRRGGEDLCRFSSVCYRSSCRLLHHFVRKTGKNVLSPGTACLHAELMILQRLLWQPQALKLLASCCSVSNHSGVPKGYQSHHLKPLIMSHHESLSCFKVES